MVPWFDDTKFTVCQVVAILFGPYSTALRLFVECLCNGMYNLPARRETKEAYGRMNSRHVVQNLSIQELASAEQSAELHEQEYGGAPHVTVSAPGSVLLMGAYTEHSDGLVFGLPLEHRMIVSIGRRTDNSLRFFAADLNERKRTSVSALKYKREDRWANYLKGVVMQLQRLGCPVRGLNVTVSGSVPSGIGLGSSAALQVACAVALKNVYDFKVSDMQLLQCARRAEQEYTGVETGLSAYLTTYFAEPGHAVYIDSRSLEHSLVPVSFEDAFFVVTNPHVQNCFSEEDESARRDDCRLCVEKLHGTHGGYALRDYGIEDVEEGLGIMSEDVRRRCLHVVNEMQRVREAIPAIRTHDKIDLGKMMVRSHTSLRDLYEVSYPELDWLVKRSCEITGIHGAKLAGSATGCCVVTLIDQGSLEAYREKLDEYERIFGFPGDYFVLNLAAASRLDTFTP